MPTDVGPGYSQPQLYDDRVLHIIGSRVYTAAKDHVLPAHAQITTEPSGYADLGGITKGKVDFSIDKTQQAINMGRIDTARRYYLQAQTGKISGSMQEFWIESFSFADGQGGVIEAVAGGNQIYLGGQLSAEQRILVTDDPDAHGDANEPLDQGWLTSPNVQFGGNVTRAENGDAWVVPFECTLLGFQIDGIDRLAHLLWIDA